jgi:hypothetical protein
MSVWIPRPKPPVYNGDVLATKRCEEIDAEIDAFGLARLQKSYPDHDFTKVMPLVREFALSYIEMKNSAQAADILKCSNYDAELKHTIATENVLSAARDSSNT